MRAGSRARRSIPKEASGAGVSRRPRLSLGGEARQRSLGPREAAAMEDRVRWPAVTRELGHLLLELLQRREQLVVRALVRGRRDHREMVRRALQVAERADCAAGKTAARAVHEA